MNQTKDQNVQVLNTLLVMHNTVKNPLRQAMTFKQSLVLVISMNVVYFVWHISINHNLWLCFLYIQWTTQVWISAFSASQNIFTHLSGGWFFCQSWFELFFAKKPIFKIYSLLTCLMTHNPHFPKFVTILPCWNKSILYSWFDLYQLYSNCVTKST